jgi:hypothetical protein
MNKSQQLIILRGARTKVGRLQILVRTHFNADGWDTEEYGKEAARLIDEIRDMMQALRNEVT